MKRSLGLSLPVLLPVRSPALELCRRTCGKYRDL